MENCLWALFLGRHFLAMHYDSWRKATFQSLYSEHLMCQNVFQRSHTLQSLVITESNTMAGNEKGQHKRPFWNWECEMESCPLAVTLLVSCTVPLQHTAKGRSSLQRETLQIYDLVTFSKIDSAFPLLKHMKNWKGCWKVTKQNKHSPTKSSTLEFPVHTKSLRLHFNKNQSATLALKKKGSRLR